METDPPDVVGMFRRYNYSSKQLWNMVLCHEKSLMKSGSEVEPGDCGQPEVDKVAQARVENAKDFKASKLNYGKEDKYQLGNRNCKGSNDVEILYASAKKSMENGDFGKSQDKVEDTKRSKSQEGPKVKISLCRNWVRPSKMGKECKRDESDCWYYHGSFPCKFYHLGNQCKYGDRCMYTHGGPLSNHLKQVLALVS